MPEARFLSLIGTTSASASQQLGWKPKWNAETALKKLQTGMSLTKLETPVLFPFVQAQIDQYVAANQVPLEAG